MAQKGVQYYANILFQGRCIILVAEITLFTAPLKVKQLYTLFIMVMFAIIGVIEYSVIEPHTAYSPVSCSRRYNLTDI